MAGKRKGRPTSFTQAKADDICEQIADGKTLRELNVPMTTVVRWLEAHPEFRAQYARAREVQADALAEEIVAVARKAKAEDAQAVRVRVDALKWAAGKLRPKVYGDKIEQEHTGKVAIDLSSLPLETLKAMLADDPDDEDSEV